MVTLQKIDDSSVKFVFEDSDHYLFGDGEIVVPVNSLSLVIDDSEMVTFKKSATGDPFISFRADNSNLGTKAAIEAFYKENMVGGSGGVSEEEVQEMIDAATSGIPSSQVIEQLRTDVNTVSGQAQTNASDIEEINEKEEVIASALTEVRQNKQDKLQYYEENTEEGYADIYMRNDDGQGNVDEYSFNVGTGSVDLGYYNQYDDGQGNSGYTSTNIQFSNQEINLISESEENGETDGTTLTVNPTGVTINNERVLTESDGAYYISFATIATTGIRDEDWNGIVAAIDAHRPIYAGYPRTDGGILYYGVECMNKNSGNTQIVMAVSDNSQHYFYTFTKNGSNDYSYTVETREYVSQAEKAAWNAKQNALSAGTGIEISGNVISATGGGVTVDPSLNSGSTNPVANSAITTALNDKIAKSSFTAAGYTSIVTSIYDGNNNKLYARMLNPNTNGHTNTEVLAYATTITSNGNKPVTGQAVYDKLGGLSLVKITQAAYDALATKDANTLYIISNVVS